jgi:DNA-binding response OmpR family regulator
MAPESHGRPRVLVIEDEQELRELILEYLEEFFECSFALTDTEILNEAKSSQSVLMAWPLAGSDSLALFDLCRKYASVTLMPSDRGLVPPSIRSVAKIIEKPFSLATLQSQVRKSFLDHARGIFLGTSVISLASPDWGEGTVVDIVAGTFWVEFPSNSARTPTKCRPEHLKRV